MSNLLKELYQKLLTKVRIRADSAPSEHTTRKFRPWKLFFPITPFSGRQFQTSDVASFGIRSFRMVFKKKLADLWIFPFSQER
jgi:hypothetical protein